MTTLKYNRVLVTGGHGFLGRYVVEKLEHDGIIPFVPMKRDYDLRDFNACKDLYNDCHPEAVIHLAARVGGIGANQLSPGEFFYDNAVMGINLIHLARVTGVKKILICGTTCSYPRDLAIPFKETDMWNGYPEPTNAPYGIAKRSLQTMAEAYRSQYGLNAITVLPVNLYGPRDNFDPLTSHVVPAIVRKCIAAKRSMLPNIELWGDGTASRELLFVRDAADGICRALESYNDSLPLNLGTGQEIPILDLSEIIKELCEYEGYTLWDASKPNGQPRRCLDVSRARDLLGWEATTSLEDGLRETIEWYKQHGE